jgi:hypothetical protein
MEACSLALSFLLRSTEASIKEPVLTETGRLASGVLQLKTSKTISIVKNLFIV